MKYLFILLFLSGCATPFKPQKHCLVGVDVFGPQLQEQLNDPEKPWMCKEPNPFTGK